jgi:hypothetical protein
MRPGDLGNPPVDFATFIGLAGHVIGGPAGRLVLMDGALRSALEELDELMDGEYLWLVIV